MGKDCKLYYGTAGESAVGNLTELEKAKDVKLNLGAGEAEVGTRANGGWEASAQTRKTLSIDFDIPVDTSDAAYTAIKAAYLAGTMICLAALTGANDAAGSEGPMGDFAIIDFPREEPLGDEATISVTAKLHSFTEWCVVSV